MTILVESRLGDMGTCAYNIESDPCQRPRYVVHHSYRPYIPTEKEKESKRIPFKKVCTEEIVCAYHFKIYFREHPEKEFTFNLVGESNKKGIFKYDKES